MKRLYPLAFAFLASAFCAQQAGAQLIDEGYDLENGGIFYKIVGEMQVEVVARPDGQPYSPNSGTTMVVPSDFIFYPGGDTTKGTTYLITGVADGAFQNCTDIRAFDFSELVVSYGDNAFAGCTSLSEFKFPPSILSPLTVGEGAFEGCTSLTSLSFGQKVESVGSRAFAGCTSLSNVTIQAVEPPTTFVSDAFEGVTLSSVRLYVPKSGLAAYQANTFWKQFGNIQSIQEYSFFVDGIYYNVPENSKSATVTYDNEGCYSGDVVIPEKVTYNDVNYTVVKIGQYAFRNCVDLTSVTVPETVTSFTEYCFAGCTSLTKVNIPKDLSIIPSHAFDGCTSLESLEVPDGLIQLAGGVFTNCKSLKRFDLSRCSGFYLLGGSAFEGCSALEEVLMPEVFESTYNPTFYFGNKNFKGCTSLTKFTFPEYITYLSAEFMFEDCPNLKTIYCLSEKPARVYVSTLHPENVTFTEDNYANITLVVPKGCLEAYTSETMEYNGNDIVNYWSYFNTIIEDKGAGIEQTEVAAEPDGNVEIYDTMGCRVYSGDMDAANLPAGIYIVVGNGTSKKVIIR